MSGLMQVDEHEALRKVTKEALSELKEMKGRLVFHAKLQRALRVVAFPVVAYLAYSICSQTVELQRIEKKLEALNDA